MKALRRFLSTEGRVGHMPEWYAQLQAAKYLQVPPWELTARPVYWTELAWAAMRAESAAQQARAKRKKASSADGGGTQR